MSETPSNPRSTAPGWEKWHRWNASAMAPVTGWMCTAVGAAPGAHVLDLACGTGLPALALAERVRPGGAVTATDVDADMVAACGRRAHAAGVELALRQMDMHAPAFDDASFDGVTLAFALMFSPDPVQVMRGIGRLLRPGGRTAVAVWNEPARNPFFTTIFGPVSRALGAPPSSPTAPGPFRLSPPGELARVFTEAGLTDVVVEPVALVYAFDSVDAHWECCVDMAPPVRNAALSFPPDDLAALRRAVTDAIAPHVDAATGRVSFTQSALCASARRSE
jgi:SAM-dependent methyltransferase